MTKYQFFVGVQHLFLYFNRALKVFESPESCSESGISSTAIKGLIARISFIFTYKNYFVSVFHVSQFDLGKRQAGEVEFSCYELQFSSPFSLPSINIYLNGATIKNEELNIKSSLRGN